MANGNNGNNEPQTKRAAWEDADCIDREVITTKGPNESQEEFCDRHDSTVLHDMALYGVKDKPLKEMHMFKKKLLDDPDSLKVFENSPHW